MPAARMFATLCCSDCGHRYRKSLPSPSAKLLQTPWLGLKGARPAYDCPQCGHDDSISAVGVLARAKRLPR